jgi:DNA-binding CsgD family transcriptional regulator/tetratricopeptide (TPR) repeat protein
VPLDAAPGQAHSALEAGSPPSGDTLAMRSRLTSSHFVGRVGELAELQLAVREASSARPTLVLLGGDSGVGKTRLVAELEGRLASEPAELDGRLASEPDPAPLILRGDCVEQADGELPYAPLLGALRPLARGSHPALDSLTAASRAQLATILPSLDDGRPRDERADTGAQLRLFEAMLELIDLLSESSTVVLILEDMHWADRSTRSFVAFLARTLRRERLAVLLTYRTDELHRRHPLRPLVSELERLDRTRRIELEPFDREELGEALTDILGAEPEQPLLERLYARSEGNPLYTEELLAAGLDGRGAAPQSLRDAFTGRIERLSPEGQQVTRAVAVGRSLDEPTLGAVTGLERDKLQAALREAVAEQILVPGDDGRFGFRHALLREALYDDLLPGERSELHLVLARYLERMCERGDERELERVAAVANHYASAGDQPAALRTAVRAAEAAEQMRAFGEAADLAERALELWHRVPEDERPDIDHVMLLGRAARAHAVGDDRPRAEVLLKRALMELDPDEDPARYAALLSRLARTIWALNRGEEGVAAAERALAMVPPEDPFRVRPLLQAWLARTKFLRGRFRQAAADGERALKTAIEAGDESAEAEVSNTLGMAYVALGRVDEGVASLRRAIDLGRQNDEPDTLVTAYSNLADMLLVAGRTREGLATAHEGMREAPKRLVRTHDWMTLTVSEQAFHAGDWKGARSHLTPPISRLTGTLLIFRLTREAELALGVGDEDLAERMLADAEPLVLVSAEPQWIGLFGSLQAELSFRRRDLDGARAAVQDALDRLELCTDDVIRIARVSAVGARAESFRAQRARDFKEATEVRDALARARIHVQRLEAAAAEGGPVEHAYMLEAKAELAQARGRTGFKEWARVAAAWEAIDRPYPAAIARWREAEGHVNAGDRAVAAEVARAALRAARELGSRWLSDEIVALGERARLELEAARSTDGGPSGVAIGAEEPTDPFGLTPRERQVLALLAEGATNRQIGAALFMAEKTASVHVSRILAKLGVQGRTQAAAVAHRQHLA